MYLNIPTDFNTSAVCIPGRAVKGINASGGRGQARELTPKEIFMRRHRHVGLRLTAVRRGEASLGRGLLYILQSLALWLVNGLGYGAFVGRGTCPFSLVANLSIDFRMFAVAFIRSML